MIRQEVAAACFRSRPPRPPQPKRFSVDPSPGLPPSIRPRRSPRTCPTTPTTPADFRAPPNARPSNPHRPSPLAVAISAARGFPPRRLSDAGPSALAPASVSGPGPKPLTKPAVCCASTDGQIHSGARMSLQLRSEASVLNKMRLLPPSDNTSAQFAQLLAGAEPVAPQAFMALDHVAGQRRAERLDPEPRARLRQGLVGPRQLRRTFCFPRQRPEQQPNPARPASRETCVDVPCAGTKISGSYQA